MITAVFLFFIAAGSLFSFSSGSCCIAFHSTLEERQKDIVRLILDSLSGYEYEIKLPFSISPDEAETIVDHVLTDYPELFYVGDEYYYTQAGESAPVSAITFTPRMPRRQAERIWKQMMSRTAPLLSSLEGKSDYQKARLVHDWLAENVSYSLDSTSDYTPYGAILRGKAACEGYAEAYTLLLRQLGVSASVVGGTGVTADGSEAHAWNIVRINDEYVLVDVTWDDEEESDRISHIYFALNDELMGRDHIPQGSWARLPASTSLMYSSHEQLGLSADSSTDFYLLLRRVMLAKEGSIRFDSAQTMERFMDELEGHSSRYIREYGDPECTVYPDYIQLACSFIYP